MENNKAEKESKPLDEQANESVVDNLPANPADSETKENEQESVATDVLKDELAAQKDKYLRLYSEFENFRRRTSKEKLDMIQSANEQLLKTLLPVVDDFERAEKAVEDKNSKNVEGFLLIYNKFKKILDQYSVKVMEIKTGDGFDADFHEAITQIPAPEEKLKGKIVDVVEKGYLLNDKVIRFAKVVVGG
ncbi:MAG TPA: nucleotide exchange factor GrpE [Ohtaekwangia sp.]|nr:nucleotide exchange factor GrpE [Ohtaekwangia sp.]